MGRINAGRVVLGGLLAGLITNIGEYILHELILKSQWAAVQQSFNLPPQAGSTIAIFVIGGFVSGIVTIWLYAAVRPRLGAGAMTAAKVGAIVWFFGCLMAMLAPLLMGMLPSNLVWTMVAWCFVEIILATIIGAAIYKEV